MANFRYPQTDRDSAPRLLSLLGSAWTVYGGADQLSSILFNRSQADQQQSVDLQEAQQTVCRLTVPIWHTLQWVPLRLRESQRNSVNIALLRYGEGAVYGNDPETGVMYRYGEPREDWSVFPAPSGLHSVPLICDHIRQPARVWVSGLDFQVDLQDQALIFRGNPFDDPNLQPEPVYDETGQIDRELILWGFRAQIDRAQPYNFAGYLLDLNLPSSQNYLDYVNALLDNVVEGASLGRLAEALSAAADVPLAAGTEVVEYIVSDSRYKLIITNEHVYRYPLNAVPIVEVHDTVTAGQPLVDSIQFYELHNGQVPEGLVALEVGEGLLAPGFASGITFHNKEVPLEVSTDGVFTRVEFEVGGDAAAVAAFWDEFHRRGVDAGTTLAHLLDQRTNKTGEPTAGALPATINPLEFLVQNVLRNNTCIVTIKLPRCGDNKLPLQHLRLLRRVIPPHTQLLIVVELAADPESITMDGSGDTLTAGYDESAELLPALSPVAESIDPPSDLTETVTLAYTQATC